MALATLALLRGESVTGPAKVWLIVSIGIRWKPCPAGRRVRRRAPDLILRSTRRTHGGAHVANTRRGKPAKRETPVENVAMIGEETNASARPAIRALGRRKINRNTV